MFLNGARGASSGCRLLQLKKLLLLKWKKKILIVYIRPPYTKILAPCTIRIVATWSRITYSFLVISVHKTPAYSKVRDKRGTTDKQATYFPLLKLANTARKEIGVVVGGWWLPAAAKHPIFAFEENENSISCTIQEFFSQSVRSWVFHVRIAAYTNLN